MISRIQASVDMDSSINHYVGILGKRKFFVGVA